MSGQNTHSKANLLISRHSDSQKNILSHAGGYHQSNNSNLASLIGGRDNKFTRRQTFTQR